MSSTEEKLDQLVRNMQDVRVSLESLKSSLTVLLRAEEDHESRIRIIERWQSNLTPVLSIGTFIGGALFQILLSRWL